MGLVPRMNLVRLVGRMFLIHSLASSLPLEVVPQLLCVEEVALFSHASAHILSWVGMVMGWQAH